MASPAGSMFGKIGNEEQQDSHQQQQQGPALVGQPIQHQSKIAIHEAHPSDTLLTSPSIAACFPR
jgi:hypothetical protein